MPINRWTPEEIEDLRRMYPDPLISREELERHVHRTWNTIKKQAVLRAIRRHWTQIWNEADETIVQEMYVAEDIPPEHIMKQLGRIWRSICHKANELNIRRAKPNRVQARRDYFHVLDSDEKAYWLGFIAADGAIMAGPRYSLTLDLQPRDLHWVERFRDTLAPGATITRHGERSCSVSISSQELVTDLLSYGISPRKSNTLQWSNIPEHAVIPFLLGYFDGDGSLVRRKDRPNGFQWILLGTYPFLCQAPEHIQRIAKVPLHEPRRTTKNARPHLFEIRTYDRYVVILDAILNASRLGLPRKYLP